MNIDMNVVIENARVAANEATNRYLSENGENPMGCGFAWVDVKVRGNTKVGKFLKTVGFKKPYVGTGLSLWNPSASFTQDMDAKVAGARAFADVLNAAGIPASVGCRLD
jgi:hypothetical protein